MGKWLSALAFLTQGYLHDQANSEEHWRGDSLHTKDMGTIDPQAYLRITDQITDRIKDVIKSGGEWISSLVLEEIISQCPGISEVAVIARPDEKWGERPLALIVRKEGVSQVSAQQIQAHVSTWAERGIRAIWAVPEVQCVASLDKTSAGKLDKKVLRQKYG